MTVSRISTIDHTVQLTHEWLNQLSERLDWDDPQRSYRLLRVTLHALRDWLPMDEAVHLGAQMPLLLRGLYYEGWHPAGTPVKERDLDVFLARIGASLADEPEAELPHLVSTVFWLLDTRISEGEVEDVRDALPGKVRELWVH